MTTSVSLVPLDAVHRSDLIIFMTPHISTHCDFFIDSSTSAFLSRLSSLYTIFCYFNSSLLITSHALHSSHPPGESPNPGQIQPLTFSCACIWFVEYFLRKSHFYADLHGHKFTVIILVWVYDTTQQSFSSCSHFELSHCSQTFKPNISSFSKLILLLFYTEIRHD